MNNLNIENHCDLCNKKVDERQTHEQCGLSLCLSCVDYYTDEELTDLKEQD